MRGVRGDATKAFFASTGAAPRSATHTLAVVFGRVWCDALAALRATTACRSDQRDVLAFVRGLVPHHAESAVCLCLLVSYRPLANIAYRATSVFAAAGGPEAVSARARSLSRPRGCPAASLCAASPHSQRCRREHYCTAATATTTARHRRGADTVATQPWRRPSSSVY